MIDRTFISAAMATALVLGATATPSTAQRRPGPDPLTQIPAVQARASVRDGFTFAAVGDLIGPHRPMGALQEPDVEKVAKIIRDADVGLGNNEGSIFDLDKFQGYAAAVNGGGTPLSDPAVVKDLKAMGLDILAKANNHAFDYGLEGLRATEDALDAGGVLHAGSGRNRAAARAPVFMETPKGRVTVVSAASTFVEASIAGSAVGEQRDRPGISVLRTKKIALVTAEEMAGLQKLAARVGPGAAAGKDLNLFGQTYRLSDKPGVTYEMNRLDQYELLRSVRGAKEQSDLTVFTIHAHEGAGATGSSQEPGDFLPVFFHQVIEAGADMVVGHGPHYLRGIEVYKGRPIFYSLGHFFEQKEMGKAPGGDVMEGLGVDPTSLTYLDYIKARGDDPRIWFDSVVAVTTYAGGQASEVRLYPIDLGFDRKRIAMRGVPAPPTPEVAQRILKKLQTDSAVYGTKIDIENNIGVIRIPPVGGKG